MKRTLELAPLVLALVSSCALGGCKVSDVLTEHIEDPSAAIDANAEPLYKDVENAQEDETRVSTHRSTSKNLDDQVDELPVYDKDAPDNGPTDQRIQSDSSSHTEAATQGTKQSNSKKGKTKKPKKSKSTKNNQSSSKSGKNAKSKSTSKKTESGDDAGKTTSKTSSGGKGGTAQVYDDSTYKNLPDDVSKVAAAGQYATLVQMLSGASGAHLVAADSAWISRVKKFGAFDGDEGIDDVATGWSGDNDANSSGAAKNAKVSAIIKADPDVVLVDGNDDDSNLSSSAKKRLTKAGISVVVMPELGSAFTSDASITKAAKIVGSLLSDSTGGYSAQMAKSYISYHDQLVAEDADYWYKPGYVYKYQTGKSTKGSSKQGPVTTAFVDHLASTTTDRTKASRNYSAYGDSLYLDGEFIDVSDGVGMSLYGSGYVLMDYYFQLAGLVDNSYQRVQPSESAATPIVAGQDARGVLGVDAANRETPSALWYQLSSDTSVLTVGDDAYPAIVCRSSEEAQAIQTSANKVNGLYNVGQKYWIYTIPTGLAGNWADGTVESFLIRSWAGVCLTSSTPSATDQDTLKEGIQSFYTSFYRADETKVANRFKASLYDPLRASCPRS